MRQTLIQTVLVLTACYAHGQGTLQFDQQVNPTTPPGVFQNILPDPTGESFIPTLSSVGFVQFYLSDPNRNQDPTLSVNLWSGSIGDGILLGHSSSVTVATTFFGVTTFSFSTPIAVTPGTTYFFQPVIQSGDAEQVGVGFLTYPSGMGYFQGNPDSSADLWFREGIVVPEPSIFSFSVLGLLGFCAVSRKRWRLKS